MAIDPVIKDHQLWLGFVQPEGLVVSPHALKNAQAVLSRNVTAQQEILRRQTVPNTHKELQLKDFPSFTQEFWGWRQSDLANPPDQLSARLSEYGETLRPTWVVPGGKSQPEHLILVQELPSGTDFDKSDAHAEQHLWQAPPQARFERLLRETGLSIGLLVSPSQIRLVYAPKGETSGHITFPIHQMTMAANWPVLAALHLLLHSDRLFIGPEAQRLPAILVASRRYQNEVSIRLAGQVLRALNELVRGFQEADRHAHGKILGETLRHDPNHIYGGMLTTLMRMVFVLYAEDRSLMGSDETWLQDYSISGLYERLRADAGQYPDTMDGRYGAWANIITLTRLLYDGGGHRSWRLPPRHGGLFDPDAFPFLEGRSWESKRAAQSLIEPPLVSDGILFRILQDLLYLEGERISYRALDVEQIGSVYEAMMGFTVELAQGVSIGLGSDHLVVNLEDLLSKKPSDRPKWLKENGDCEVTGKAVEQLRSATSVDEILAALRRRISKLYLDQNSNPVTVPTDGIFLQPTEERRRSGSHYTPRSLTQPIVKTTLDPVMEQLGDNPTPEQILALKVCDPAMGSGAFLVEVCRYLGEKLEKAWITHDQLPRIPADQDPLLHARRIVAQRCLYGVDKNPFAVNLAKLSLWLATFAKDHPFTFVDHTLRCGDSLVGLTAHQIEAFHWKPKEEGALLRNLPSRLRHILDTRAQILDAADETPYETLAQKLAKTDEQMIDLRLAGDLTISSFFGADKPKDREVRRKQLTESFRRAQERITDLELEDELRGAVRVLKAGPKGVTPFHWEIEFPEVFRLDDSSKRSVGFHALVGNPPFAGVVQLARARGEHFSEFLREYWLGVSGQTDLAAFFFRRSFDLLRQAGCLGLLATNTIAQGDTRESGLSMICENGGEIYHVTKRIRWPGRANVIVSRVHISKGRVISDPVLSGRRVERISAFLFHSGGDRNPLPLQSKPCVAGKGIVPWGMGFVFEDGVEGGPSLKEMAAVVAANPSCSQRIHRFIGGADLNSIPDLTPNRFIIDLDGLPEQEAKRYPELFAVLERYVRPQRLALPNTPGNRRLRERWWHYSQGREIREATRNLCRVLLCSQTSKRRAFAFVDGSWIFDQKAIGFACSDYAFFAVMQSRAHEVWSDFFGSTMKDDPVYTPPKCFDTFPFPDGWRSESTLDDAGRAYYEFRADLMLRNDEGLTEIYNRFHDPEERDSGILRLRELHAEMEVVVIQAYGWADLRPRLDFIPDYEDEGDQEDTGREGKKQWRYRWVDDDRDEILARMIELNRTRAEEESKPLANTQVVKTRVMRAGKLTRNAPIANQHLFEAQESTE